MSNVPTDAELQARADRLGAQFVNESKLRANIKDVQFIVVPGSQLTICVLTLFNGYTVTGESACADPKMFDREVGEKFAFAAAERKVWPLMGYALKQELYLAGAGTTFQDRVIAEEKDLRDKCDKICAFINGNVQFNKLSVEEQADLKDQYEHMRDYLAVLVRRIRRF